MDAPRFPANLLPSRLRGPGATLGLPAGLERFRLGRRFVHISVSPAQVEWCANGSRRAGSFEVTAKGGSACGEGNCQAANKGWVHFVGVGGCGLSALAMLALKQGFEVSGSDIVWSNFAEGLHKAGARLFLGHSVSNFQRDGSGNVPDAVVISSAISSDNVEVSHAKENGIPVYKRGEWLGRITKNHVLVAVSGTHGKSTTSAMLAYVVDAMGYDVSAIIGAHVPQLPDGNIIYGGGLFIVEADEYDGCFLGMSPNIVVVTNMEWEHVDFFKDEKAVEGLYRMFLSQIKPGGYLVLCGDSAGACSLLESFRKDNSGYEVTTYGIRETNEWHASSIKANTEGGMDYVLYHWESPIAKISIQMPGVHNICNSLAVIATIMTLFNDTKGINEDIRHVSHHLYEFRGVSRRFEFIGVDQGCWIFDDYAHHPSEVIAIIQAARLRFPHQRLWVVFQPHTYSRLATLMKDFTAAFSHADHVIVTEVYAAREVNNWDVSGKDLADLIVGPSSEYVGCLEDVVDRLLLKALSKRDAEMVILTLGAGDVTTVGPALLRKLQQVSREVEEEEVSPATSL